MPSLIVIYLFGDIFRNILSWAPKEACTYDICTMREVGVTQNLTKEREVKVKVSKKKMLTKGEGVLIPQKLSRHHNVHASLETFQWYILTRIDGIPLTVSLLFALAYLYSLKTDVAQIGGFISLNPYLLLWIAEGLQAWFNPRDLMSHRLKGETDSVLVYLISSQSGRQCYNSIKR